MYHFAILVFTALALIKVVDFIVDQLASFERMRSILTFAGGIGAMVVLDYSLFRAWNIEVSADWLGVLFTGLIVAGMTVVWRAAFSWLTHHKSPIDEPLGDSHPLLQRVG